MKWKSLTRFLSAIIGAAAGLVIFTYAAAPAQDSSLKTLKVGGGSFTRSIAQSNGIFAKYGLRIELIAAHIEAQHWIMNPANKDKVIEIVAQQAKVPRDLAGGIYEADTGPNGLAKDAAIGVARFTTCSGSAPKWREVGVARRLRPAAKAIK